MMSTQTLAGSAPDPSAGTSAGRRKRPWIIALLILVGLAVVYLAIGFFSGRVVAPGTTVAGVDIGSQSAADAKSTLEDALGEKAKQEIELSAKEATATIDPVKSGLALDVDGTVAQVTGFTLNPAILADRLFGDNEVSPVLAVDDATFDKSAEAAAKGLEVEPVDAELSYDKTTPAVKDAVTGQSVSVENIRSAVAAQWLVKDNPLPVVVDEVEPDITTAEAKDVADGFAADAVKADVTVKAVPGKDADSDVKGGDLTISPTTIAKTLSFEAKDSKLVPKFDAEKLQKRALDENEEIGRPAKDATFKVVDGKPQVVDSEPGIGIKPDDLSKAVTDAINGDTAAAEVTLASVEPEFTTEDAKKVDVSQTVSEFSTPYKSDPNRDNNLRVASKEVSGTVLQPGEQFSLNETLGPRTAANGYKPAGVISEGQMKEDFGGGVSQVSTTLFNAAFFAGFELNENQAHSRYISRYPEGRETTLDYTSIDLKFTNNQKTPVVLDMYLSGGKVYAKVYGVKYYDVEADSSGRYAFTSPATVTESGPSCTPQSPREGWSIKITRTMKEIATGRETKDSFVTTYRPVNKVECK
ncbi:VanW family protein [Brevibacterium casei]|uniref:VanW family protein n=2 Tax=Bacteria TaxID=2 RepID=UPI0028A9EE89|nr:VanW family protein [Brevibacterium casei]